MSSKKPSSNKSQMAGTDTLDRGNTNLKLQSLETFRDDATDQALRTNQGVKIADNQNTLKAGSRGPSLLEDFIMREKITHFDHERIPERIVHARGTGAHGYFQAYKSHSALTKAGFLQDPGKQTPVFVRFSTVQGPRGSGDTVVTFAVLRSSFSPTKATSTWSATTCRYFLYKMRSNFLTSFMP